MQLEMNRAVRDARGRANAVSFQLSPARLQTRLANARKRFDIAHNSCSGLMGAHLEEARTRLGLAANSLDALSPLAVLQRGYAIAQDRSGNLLRDAQSASVGDSIRVRLAKGRLAARVEGIEKT
jgi:exodeoxyribonuclease VII large subunit